MTIVKTAVMVGIVRSMICQGLAGSVGYFVHYLCGDVTYGLIACACVCDVSNSVVRVVLPMPKENR